MMRDFIGSFNSKPLLVALGLAGVVSGVHAHATMLDLTPDFPEAASAKMLGVCHAINGLDDIFPTSDAARYFANIKHQNFVFDYYPDGSVRQDISIRILEQPKHGKLVQNEPEAEDIGKYSYNYIPDENYSGYDKFVMEALAGGNIVQIYYTMSVSLPGEPTYTLDDNGNKVDDLSRCPKPYWKISAILKSDGTNIVTSVEYQTSAGASVADTAVLASTLGSSVLSNLAGDTTGVVNLTFADLTGSALGQTTGSNITLDTNAAGYNWFIDTTPADNSEFLPTSNPNEWVAKAGTAAAGKMDMLSVLLHEYGHALGIDHSADPNDYMGTTLTAGVRRLPSAEEMALMQGLVAQAKVGLAESTPSLTLPDGTTSQSTKPASGQVAGYLQGGGKTQSIGSDSIDSQKQLGGRG